MIFFAQCAKSQQDLVLNEIKKLKTNNIKQIGGGVEFESDLENAYRFCLTSRYSTRLLKLLKKDFNCTDADKLYELSSEIEWENFISDESSFAVTCTAQNTKWLQNSHYGLLRVKDSVVDRIRLKYNDNRPNVDTDNPDATFHIHIFKNIATWYVDFSGRSLHKRSYKKEATKATLKEDLAATILTRSGFHIDLEKKIDFYDPFCGSGTLAIEAALMAKNIAPGLLKPYSFDFCNLKDFDSDLYESLLDEYESKITKSPIKIFASDYSEKAIEISKENAKRANVLDDIEFFVQDFTEIDKDFVSKNVHIICDPPYGIRMGYASKIIDLFHKSRIILEKYFGGSRVSIIANDPSYLTALALKPEKTNIVYNGGNECQLAHYRLFSKEEREIMRQKNIERREKRLNTPLSSGAQMVYNRLEKNLKELKPKMEKQKVTCYRIYDADMPEYNASVDNYENKWLIVNEYAPPKTIDPTKAKNRLEELVLALERITNIDIENIFIKTRRKQKGSKQYDKFDDKKQFFIINENNLHYTVNFEDYLDTGIFLDHRPTRKFIKENSKDKRFLNLFCYTGTATVAAASGGALSSVSVDLSSKYLDWTQKNLENNNLATMNHIFYNQDSIFFLKNSWDKYDLIFCDPPTFSNSKKKNIVFDVQRDHLYLIHQCMDHLEKNGLLIFSNNFKKFTLDQRILDKYNVKDVTQESIGDDFKNSKKIHWCYHITHKQKVKKVKRIKK